MTTTSGRLLALLSLLQGRRDWSGEVLAGRLEVSVRTVRRDVERLRALGYRITTVKGPDGGYRLEAGADLPPLLFDDDQALALAVALQVAATDGAGLGEQVGEAALRALTTVRQVLPSRLRHRLDALPLTALGRRDVPSPAVDPDVLLALGAVVHAREVLRFDYGRAEQGESEAPRRRVEPHRLVVRAGRWYLLAWDLDRQDWRTFRADRIRPRIPTGPRFVPREVPGGDVAAFVTARVRGAASPAADGGSGWPCVGEVVLDLPVDRVRPFVHDGWAEPAGPGRTRLTEGSWSWAALAAGLARFDSDIVVVGPPALRDAFDALARRAERAAGSGTA